MADKDLSELQVQFIKGVGPRRAALLEKLGVRSVLDALMYFPVRYDDRRNIRKIREIVAGARETVTGSVVSSELKDLRRGRGRPLKLLEVTVYDGTGIVRAKWFNQPYLKRLFRAGREVVLDGPVKYGYRGAGLELENPDYEFMGAGDDPLVHTGRIVPVYRATESLSSRQIRAMLFNVLHAYGDSVDDPLPA